MMRKDYYEKVSKAYPSDKSKYVKTASSLILRSLETKTKGIEYLRQQS